MSKVIESIEQRQLRRLPNFGPGDRVKVHFEVVEGNRRRTQVFEGVVIKRQGSGARETFTVRKQSFGVGVERTFPVHSPKIEKLEIAARGEVRRAKLYYLRGRVGKRARIAERRWAVSDDILPESDVPEAVDADGETVAEAEAEPPPPEEGTEGEGAESAEAESSGTEAQTDAEASGEDVIAPAPTEEKASEVEDGGEPSAEASSEPGEDAAEEPSPSA